jgi:hypothetical protein
MKGGIAQSIQRLAAGWTFGVRFPSGTGISLFITTSRPALAGFHPDSYPTGAGIKRPERQADLSPLPSAQLKYVWFHTSTPSIRLQGEVLNLLHPIRSVLWLSSHFQRHHPTHQIHTKTGMMYCLE